MSHSFFSIKKESGIQISDSKFLPQERYLMKIAEKTPFYWESIRWN